MNRNSYVCRRSWKASASDCSMAHLLHLLLDHKMCLFADERFLAEFLKGQFNFQ